MKKPTIIIFNPDSYRGDVLGHLGNAAAVTPNLDAVVRDGGVSYANAFAQNPVCTPSRCSFMTGWYPHVHGHRSMRNMLKPHEPSLLSVLRREGYHVWWGGKNDLFMVERREDYLKYCNTKFRPTARYKGYRPPPPLPVGDPRRGVFYGGVLPHDPDAAYGDYDRACVEGAIEKLRNHTSDEPLCLYLPLGAPHPPYSVEAHFYDLVDPARLPPRLPVPARDLPALDALRCAYGSPQVDEASWRDLKRIYYAMCAKVDHLFGLVVQTLKDKGMYDDALIVFLSDHGDFAGDYGLPEKTHLSLQDALLRSPFVIKPPKSLGAVAGVRSHLTELVDMTATVYDLLGIAPGYDSHGRSLVKSLRGDDNEIREAVFAEVGSRRGEPAFKNLDVTRLPSDAFYAVQSRAAFQAHDAGSLAVSCRTRDYKYVRRGYCGHHELYDLRKDPGELVNLSGTSDCAEIERGMERRLLDHFMTTADVLPHEQDSRMV